MSASESNRVESDRLDSSRGESREGIRSILSVPALLRMQLGSRPIDISKSTAGGGAGGGGRRWSLERERAGDRDRERERERAGTPQSDGDEEGRTGSGSEGNQNRPLGTHPARAPAQQYMIGTSHSPTAAFPSSSPSAYAPQWDYNTRGSRGTSVSPEALLTALTISMNGNASSLAMVI